MPGRSVEFKFFDLWSLYFAGSIMNVDLLSSGYNTVVHCYTTNREAFDLRPAKLSKRTKVIVRTRVLTICAAQTIVCFLHPYKIPTAHPSTL
ncbi:hypothetical protein EG68_08809 [Paragonimus skrjabini miyazakii]|uniref:Uncharacterized protein n=1 Tax=Paragonimus skrjabini miyazakii TaxID=59628 RepID=A0A8S9YYV4_9TREM|nr:hypothetical protein EG68_08809 [Paragonimus skrjabini miyazakii]